MNNNLPAKQKTDYFERIPEWSPQGKRFEVLSDEISGRIPVTRVESWQDFTNALQGRFFNRSGIQLAYRGQRRYDWSLTPSLGRITASGIVSRDLAERQLTLFKRAVRGRVNDCSLVDEGEEDELWSVGQHHDLMTPLLDWTYSPYVALFFAFAKEDPTDHEERDNPYRVVYAINKTFLSNKELCPDIRVMEPRKDEFGRLVNQAGLFTFSPYDATIENKLADVLSAEDFPNARLREADESEQPDILAEYICKIYIKNEGRDACLRHLRQMNVHHASLFPDILGAAQYCNICITEQEVERAEQPKATKKRIKIKRRSHPAPEEPPALPPVSNLADRITTILKAPKPARHVTTGRLHLIADQLQSELSKHMLVDWEDRESLKARMRNSARIILRKYGYPPGIRDEVTTHILDVLAKKPK